MLERYLKMILNSRVYDVAEETPLAYAERLSQRLGNDIRMKREDLQPVFSFKLRGAYNKLAAMDDAALASGVICSSAGNHAQGVALAARKRGIPAIIVMPVTTPSIKVHAVRDLGGEVVLHGDTYDEAYRFAKGETVTSSTGLPARLAQPLDFLVISDHAENLGINAAIEREDEQVLSTSLGTWTQTCERPLVFQPSNS